MAEHEPEDVGRKGGAAEHYIGAQPVTGARFYEPLVTAVTDIVVPASRIQWGPVFAGLLIALSVTFLMSAFGMGLGLRNPGIFYWIVGFASIGLLLGAMHAARVTKSGVWPAILHAVVLWSLFMVLHIFTFSNIGSTIVSGLLTRTPGVTAGTAATTNIMASSLGWWFFGGFLVMLAASILGAIAGVNPPVEGEETTHGTAVER